MTGKLSSFHGASVMVTGHSGFKGAWLTSWLKHLGANVQGLSISVPTEPALFDDLGGEESQHTTWMDVCDTDLVTEQLNANLPDYIFHLAAQPIVQESFADPVTTWRTNTLGTVSMMEAIRRSALTSSNVVMITSDKVYRNQEWLWGYREGDELGGIDPYSASKASAELAIRSYSSSGIFGKQDIRVASVRAGNVIGGGDWAPDRIVPDSIRAWQKGLPLQIRFPLSTRPWQHVLEPLGGYLLTAKALASGSLSTGEALNFGPDIRETKSVEELVSRLSHQLGGKPPLSVTTSQASVHESRLLSLSSEKARDSLGWHPLMSFDTTVDWTAAWYASRAAGSEAAYLVAEQIRAYEQLIEDSEDWGSA